MRVSIVILHGYRASEKSTTTCLIYTAMLGNMHKNSDTKNNGQMKDHTDTVTVV